MASDDPLFTKSDLEHAFDTQYRRLATDMPVPEQNFYFAKPQRAFRFDRAWPDHKVAVELEGIRPRPVSCHNCGADVRAIGRGGKPGKKIMLYGWHQRFGRFKSDKEKYNLAVSLGWYVLRFFHDDVYGDPFSMVDLIRTVLRSRPSNTKKIYKLSERENQILHMIAAGMTGGEIADELGLNHNTIRTHTSNIRTKLITSDRASSVARAFCWGLLDVNKIPWPDQRPTVFDEKDF